LTRSGSTCANSRSSCPSYCAAVRIAARNASMPCPVSLLVTTTSG
jgi:hypothetical protein